MFLVRKSIPCAAMLIAHLHRLVKSSYEATLSKLVQVTEEQIQLAEQTEEKTSGEEPSKPLDGAGFTSVTLMASAQRVDMDSKVALAIRCALRYIEHCCTCLRFYPRSQRREEKYAASLMSRSPNFHLTIDPRRILARNCVKHAFSWLRNARLFGSSPQRHRHTMEHS